MAGLLVDASAAFMLALLGAVHCVSMCGGFVSAIHAHRPVGVSAVRMSLGYHLGRLTSYTLAGALVGTIGGSLYAANVRPVQVALLGLGGVALVLIGLSMMGRAALLKYLEPLGLWLWRGIAPLARRVVPPRHPIHAWLAGMAWGWIPCGMVYAALPLALASGGSWSGAWVMLAFGVGTLPGMVTADLAAAQAARLGTGAPLKRGGGLWQRVRLWLRPAAGGVIMIFGVSSLAHAATMAGVNSATVALLASMCMR